MAYSVLKDWRECRYTLDLLWRFKCLITLTLLTTSALHLRDAAHQTTTSRPAAAIALSVLLIVLLGNEIFLFVRYTKKTPLRLTLDFAISVYLTISGDQLLVTAAAAGVLAGVETQNRAAYILGIVEVCISFLLCGCGFAVAFFFRKSLQLPVDHPEIFEPSNPASLKNHPPPASGDSVGHLLDAPEGPLPGAFGIQQQGLFPVEGDVSDPEEHEYHLWFALRRDERETGAVNEADMLGLGNMPRPYHRSWRSSMSATTTVMWYCMLGVLILSPILIGGRLALVVIVCTLSSRSDLGGSAASTLIQALVLPIPTVAFVILVKLQVWKKRVIFRSMTIEKAFFAVVAVVLVALLVSTFAPGVRSDPLYVEALELGLQPLLDCCFVIFGAIVLGQFATITLISIK